MTSLKHLQEIKSLIAKNKRTVNYLTLILLLIVSTSFGQRRNSEFLKKQLSITQQDTGRVIILSELCFQYRLSNPDSALLLGQQALDLARQIQFRKGEANTLSSIGFLYRGLGDLRQSLSFQLKAFQIAETNSYVNEQANSLFGIGATYVDLKGYSKASGYFHKALTKYRLCNDTAKIALMLVNLGDIYEKMNQLDSALYFVRQGHEQMARLEFAERSFALRVLGKIYMKMNKFSYALNSCQQCIAEAEEEGNVRNQGFCNYLTSELYKTKNQPDSCIYYAKKALSYAQTCNYKLVIIYSSELLAYIYEAKDIKQALYYHKLVAIAKDSLYGADKLQNLQSLVLNEQERQYQVETTREAALNRIKIVSLLAILSVMGLLGFILFRNRMLSKQNAELQAALLEGQTTERKRVAADLHDNLSSMLTAVRWNLMGLNKNNLSERERSLYDEVMTMTTSAHDQVRLISHNLLPEELEKEGLARALERLVNKLNRSGAVHLSLTITHLAERLSKKTEFELYSIILELTHNVIKHSGATEAEISLIRQNERIRLVVSDNGKGLAENRENGVGIQNVESRVKSLNGNWRMNSQEGKGVVFEAEFS